jgi:acyl-CoA thioesterase
VSFAFDDDTAATELAEGAWQLDITPRWNIGTNPNGGYLLAALAQPLRHIAARQGKPDLLTITAHYLRPTSVGVADVTVEPVRSGRRHVHLAARLVQDTERVRALAAFGDLTEATAKPALARGEPPDLPPPDECVGRTAPGGPGDGPPSMMHRFESRFAPDTPWMAGRVSEETVITGWIRFADGRPPDVASLPLFADAFPPAIFALGPTGWVPTVELTVHVRARPVPGWLRCRFETRFVAGGYLEEDGEVWDDAGRLVAQSRQLALLLGPPA